MERGERRVSAGDTTGDTVGCSRRKTGRIPAGGSGHQFYLFGEKFLVEVSFGEWLKRRRLAAGMTQAQLADKAGYAAITLRKIESEQRRPSAQMVARLAEIFEVSAEQRSDFLRFARGDWTAAPEAGETPPWHRTAPDLPAPVTRLIGREQELASVGEYLRSEEIRLVTLLGPPGIGKTRLALEAANRARPEFPGGVFFVPLASLDNPGLAAQAGARALGYVGAKAMPALEQLKLGIGERRLLLVLDNCEHLIEEAAELAALLLAACPRLTVLATSREVLRLPGEWLFPVPAFDLPGKTSSLSPDSFPDYPALTLFAERARAADPDFRLDSSNLEAVVSLCARLDGLPLAIELVAARVRWMPVQALLDRLGDPGLLPTPGLRLAPTRQQTLDSAIGWSYHLLSTQEKEAFACLSAFSGGFTLEAAEAVIPTPPGVSPAEVIASLVDKSLLQRLPGKAGSGTHYGLLATVRQYARERLREMGLESEIRDRHLNYYLAFATAGDEQLRGADQLVWLQRFASQRDNLRTALTWAIESGQTEPSLRLACRLHWFWFGRSDHTEGRQWLERVLSMPETNRHPELQAEALTQLAHHLFLLVHRAWIQSEVVSLRTTVEQALSIARKHNDRHNTARALAMLGLVLIDEEAFDQLPAIMEECQALFDQSGNAWGRAHAVLVLAFAAYSRGDLAASLALNEQALAGFRQVGDRYFISVCLRYIGEIHTRQGSPAQGEPALREALKLSQELDGKYEIAMTLWHFAGAALRTGDPVRAVYLYCAGRSVFVSIGVWLPEDETKFEQLLAPCRDALGEAASAQARAEGEALSMAKAIALAFEEA
jgi:predicted ATPase/DNA-binding XRE family transcriptional regulator